MILYSQRKKLAELCEKWQKANNAESALGVITYLCLNGLLDEWKVRVFLADASAKEAEEKMEV